MLLARVRYMAKDATDVWCGLGISLMQTCCHYQVASSLLTICSRLVIIKPEQAMRTHADIGLMTARQQACSRLAVTCAFLGSVQLVGKPEL